MRNTIQAFAVMRIDRAGDPISSAEVPVRVTVTKVLPTLESADAEVQRLNSLNSDKDCRYYWQATKCISCFGDAEMRARIKEVILKHLSSVTLLPVSEIRITADVVRELRVDGDDISLLLVPGIEKELGVELTDAAWQRMRTVADIVAGFEAVIIGTPSENPKAP